MGMLSLCNALHASAVSATTLSRHAVPLHAFGKHVKSSKHGKHMFCFGRSRISLFQNDSALLAYCEIVELLNNLIFF